MFLLLRRYFALIKVYLKPQWRYCVALALVLLANIGLQLVNPQLLKAFIDSAQAHGISRSLLIIVLLFVGTVLLNQLTAIGDTYLSEYIAWTATNQLRRDLVAHCLSLDLAFHKTHRPGERIERIDGDVDTLSNFFSRLIIQLGGSFLLLLGILAIFFRMDWRVGVGTSLYALIFFRVLMTMRKKLVPLWKVQRQKSADFYGFLGEYLEGITEIRANGATAVILQRFLLLLRNWFPLSLKTSVTRTWMQIINFALIASGVFLSLLAGAYLHVIHPATVSVGTVLAMYLYIVMIISPIWSIQTNLQDLQQVEACLQRLDELLGTTSALRADQGLVLAEGPLTLEFDQVTFGYDADEPVLHDVSFCVQPGRVLGIAGRTGSGKTTLARLLFRLYDPQQGSIRLGGIATGQVQLRALRQQLGFVTQDVQLFHASVRDNLTFFNHEISDERLVSTIMDLGLAAWYSSLPDGLDTVLETGNGGLSAGEAQLLACTRVFLQDPALVVLDEASSRLDPATANLFEKALDRLIVGRTTIIIAHRLTTLQRADDMLVLESGRVFEYGSRESLERDPDSRFSRLLAAELKEVRA